MFGLLLLIILVWVVLAVFGFVVHGLLWLGVAAVVLLVITVILGLVRGRGRRG